MDNTNYKPSISSAFSGGMQLFKKAAGAMIGYWFIFLMISFALSMALIPFRMNNIETFSSNNTFGEESIIFLIINLILNFVLYGLWLGYHLYMNGIYKNNNEEFGTFFKGFKYVPKVILGYVITTLITFVLLAIPMVIIYLAKDDISNSPKEIFSNPLIILAFILGFIIYVLPALLFGFATELIMLAQLPVIDAIKTSFKTVWRHLGFFLLLAFLLLLINFVGHLFLFIGLIFTVPFSMCIIHVLYQKLFVTDELGESIEEFGDSQEEFVELDSL